VVFDFLSRPRQGNVTTIGESPWQQASCRGHAKHRFSGVTSGAMSSAMDAERYFFIKKRENAVHFWNGS
jgi:hypothetical protein